MKAEDLKRWPLLFKKFKKNIKKHPSKYGSYKEYIQETNNIQAAFNWNSTKQGYSFWEDLYSDNLVCAVFLQPELFSIDNQVVEVKGEVITSNGFAEWFLELPKISRENSCSLDEIKSTMEELEHYYNTVKGIGCSIIACYHSDGSGKLVRCEADGNNPIVIMNWGKKV